MKNYLSDKAPAAPTSTEVQEAAEQLRPFAQPSTAQPAPQPESITYSQPAANPADDAPPSATPVAPDVEETVLVQLSTRQILEVAQPTKRQVGAWLKAEKGYQRQQTTGAALPKHKPVNIIRRSAPLQYLQGDVFQLDERVIRPQVDVTVVGRRRRPSPTFGEQLLHPVLPRSLLPPEGVYVPGPRAQYGVPAQGKEFFSTRIAGSARDQIRSPPILEDYLLWRTCIECSCKPDLHP
eukprot:COSAG01_NODE_2144_length_8312_cov_22.048843_3_plen_237_part_00